MDMPRQATLAILRAVLGGKIPLDTAFAAMPDEVEARDRAFVRHLVSTILRRRGQLDDLIDTCLTKPLPPAMPEVRDILRVGIAQLLFMDVPDHAAINTSVELLRHQKDKRTQGFKGLVNAILRRVTREGADLVAAQDAVRLNTPDWLWDSWEKAWGADVTRQIALMHCADPPLDITLKPGMVAARWASSLEGIALPMGTIRRTGGGRVDGLKGYRGGAWWVQDIAASLPVKILAAALDENGTGLSDKKIADLCAAPGGKTAQLSALGANIVAVDRSAPRLDRLRDNLRRLELNAEIVKADATYWQPPEQLDAVLLDAPCSATGTIRRHPDVAHLKSPEDVATMQILQNDLLKSAARMIAPGGVILYCVCSLQPEEGEGQIDKFLETHTEFALWPVKTDWLPGLEACVADNGTVRTLPHFLAEQGGMDGFYMALMRRAVA